MDAVRIAKLISSDVNVYLIAKSNSPISNNYSDELYKNSIELKTIQFNAKYSLAIAYKTRKILKQHNIKNVIYLGASELHALNLAFSGLDINLIIRHGTTKSRPKKDFLHRLIYKNVNYHVAICEHLAKNIKYIFPFGKHTKLKTIYSSLRNLPEIVSKPARSNNQIIKLIHVGRIIDVKGQKDAVDACEVLFENNIPFELNLLGDFEPGCKADFIQHLKSKPYHNQIHIKGFQKNLAEYYSQADILLFPSYGEGLSNTFIEALSYGIICLSYNNTSFPELHDLGFEFYIAENLNIDSLKHNLLEASEYLKSKKLPINNNVKLAQSLFSQQRELYDYLNLLK
ncbi:MAG: glycosyltransferase [Gammaproteobacteria bacterium]|nr:glycosyltransferase [Gammaproteobacteria bacterium]